MKQKDIVERWGMPYIDLLIEFAAQGLSIRDTAAALGQEWSTVKEAARRGRLIGMFETVPLRSRVSIEYGRPFWQVVKMLADTGLNRTAVAERLGMYRQAFTQLLAGNPELDPFPPSRVVPEFIRDTGASFVEQVRAMAAQGMTANAAGIACGWSAKGGAGECLMNALAARGVTDIVFSKRAAKPKVAKAAKRKWIERGGPKGESWRERNRREFLEWQAKHERV